MYKIINLGNIEEWLNIINSFEDVDVYYYPGYLKAFCENGDGEPKLFYFENEYGKVANVFLLRDIHEDERFTKHIETGTYFDISTVYGYGGPIFCTSNLPKLKELYLIEFDKYCKEMNIVSEFIRFHPILENHKFLENSYDIQNIRSTIYIDLSNGEQGIWDCMESNCRSNIRKAGNSGIDVLIGNDKYLINEFIKLYIKTMKRDKANQYYFFEEKMFYTTMQELKDSALIFAAVLNLKIIAASMVLISDKLLHYHFAGSDIKYQTFRPNNLLIYEAAKWGSKEGKKMLHLGGGFYGDEDNLFRFKRSFSNKPLLSFYIGKKIHDEAKYNELVRLRAANDENFCSDINYFPRYKG